MQKPRIPVVMYHTINTPRMDWLWNGLTCRTELFRRQIEVLLARGYRPATLDEVHQIQAEGAAPRDKSVVFTFDDGYLDNWVLAYPVMKELGWKGVVYVNPEFIDPSEEPRFTLDDVASGACAESDLKTWGFMNRAELRILDESGVIEVASHSMSHTWYPTGPGVVDFHRPGLDTPWLAWNARPERKFAYMDEDQSGFVPWGTPIHEHGRSLGIRRWFPDPDIEPACRAEVEAGGGEAYFERSDWKERLAAVAAEADAGRGVPEADDDMLERFRHEIAGSMDALSEIVGRRVRHFCWPGGMYTDESWNAALETDILTLPVKRSDLVRWGQDDPRHLRRISSHDKVTFLGRRYETSDPAMLAAACDGELGRRSGRLELKARKSLRALGLTS